MLKTCIIGASGYTGAELIRIIERHSKLSLEKCYVSENSQYDQTLVSEVHPELTGICSHKLYGITNAEIAIAKDAYDIIFLATPHEFSHDYLPMLTAGNAKVFDLSGAYRISNTTVFENFYGFPHQHHGLLNSAVYGLAEWNKDAISQASFVAVPGCYPTASLLALKPLVESKLLNLSHLPVINATSGVSGAGKKASMTTSFYEVSLQAYGVLSHRHTPEIEEHAKSPVIFTPHLGAFKRGILATITAFTNSNVSQSDIEKAYREAYDNKPLIRLNDTMPKVDNVATTPFCDIAFKFEAEKNCIVVSSAIDNLLKGASAQAVQCANIRFGFSESEGLI